MADRPRRYAMLGCGRMEPDLALLERWRGGDRAAGQELFARHFADIYRFFENKVGAEADDLAQRTFLACARARDQFQGKSSFRTYLFAIARNELYDHLRARRQGAEVDFESASLADLGTSVGARVAKAQAAERLRA